MKKLLFLAVACLFAASLQAQVISKTISQYPTVSGVDGTELLLLQKGNAYYKEPQSYLRLYMQQYFANKYLSSFAAGPNSPVTSGDSLPRAIAKLQAQVNARIVRPDTTGVPNNYVLSKAGTWIVGSYSAGNGLTLSGNTFRADTTIVGTRAWINYKLGLLQAGTGITKTGNTFALNLTYTDGRYLGFGNNTLQNNAVMIFPSSYGFFSSIDYTGIKVSLGGSNYIKLVKEGVFSGLRFGDNNVFGIENDAVYPSGLNWYFPVDESGDQRISSRRYVSDWRGNNITSNYTVSASDAGKTLVCKNISGITITFPSGLGADFSCNIIRDSTGTVTLSQGAGVSLETSGDTYIIQNINSGASVGAVSNNNLQAIGDFQSSAGSIAANSVTNTPAGTIAATNVQAALDELDSEKIPLTQKGAASGVPTLNSSALVPPAQLGTGTADNTKFLRGDNTWQAVTTTGYQTATDAYAVQVITDHCDTYSTWEFSGSGNSAVVTDADGGLGIRIGTGSGSTNSRLMTRHRNSSGNNSVQLGTKAQTFAFVVSIPTLRTSGEEFSVNVGLMDSGGGFPTNQLIFLYSSADIHWQMKSADSGGSSSTNTSSVTVTAGQQYLLEIVIDASASVAAYYIDGVNVYNAGSTIIPDGASKKVTPFVAIFKSNGTGDLGIISTMFQSKLVR